MDFKLNMTFVKSDENTKERIKINGLVRKEGIKV
jgi:hypothetical protein